MSWLTNRSSESGWITAGIVPAARSALLDTPPAADAESETRQEETLNANKTVGEVGDEEGDEQLDRNDQHIEPVESAHGGG